MAGSLKDQLLKAGVASRKQAKDIELQKRKQKKQGKPQQSPEDHERAAAIERARQEKIQKDRLLNEQRHREQEQRAARAEIRQLVKQHRVHPPRNGEVRYNFIWNDTVQSLWVDAELQKQLSAQTVVIVAVDQAFALVPAAIAERIRQRDPATVVQDDQTRRQRIAAEEADYAEFPIPDDLHW